MSLSAGGVDIAALSGGERRQRAARKTAGFRRPGIGKPRVKKPYGSNPSRDTYRWYFSILNIEYLNMSMYMLMYIQFICIYNFMVYKYIYIYIYKIASNILLSLLFWWILGG